MHCRHVCEVACHQEAKCSSPRPAEPFIKPRMLPSCAGLKQILLQQLLQPRGTGRRYCCNILCYTSPCSLCLTQYRRLLCCHAPAAAHPDLRHLQESCQPVVRCAGLFIRASSQQGLQVSHAAKAQIKAGLSGSIVQQSQLAADTLAKEQLAKVYLVAVQHKQVGGAVQGGSASVVVLHLLALIHNGRHGKNVLTLLGTSGSTRSPHNCPLHSLTSVTGAFVSSSTS